MYTDMDSDDDQQTDVLPCHEKLAFDTKREADASANVVEYRYGSKVHAYVCRYCGLWHLSSNTAD